MNSFTAHTRREFLGRSVGLGAAAVLGSRFLEDRVAAAAEANSPKGWVLGCYTRPWDRHDYRVALDAIAEAGFKQAGLMTTKSKSHLVLSVSTTPEEASQVAEEIKKRGLQVPSVYGGGFPLDSIDLGVKALRRLIDACAIVGSQSLLMGGITEEKQYAPYYKVIAECCDYAAEKKLLITIKPHGGSNSTGPQCRKCLEAVGHKNFKLWYDPGNIFFYSDGKIDPVDDSTTVDGIVAGMCVKDFKLPKEVFVTPGTGQVNFAKVLANLKKGGFTDGHLIVETFTLSDPNQSDLPKQLAEAKKARQYMLEVMKQA